ncbi:ABC transporter ATP-binding protein [Bacillus massiliigorillae]|uniref:ABC transporter ATP-binding protein n=1 Tax=Bacillus massiliigorillae TaxID=1243664 RepID=UPI00039E5599|nr:ABC transporter ATP-binding protein [Bacillus massiliigorillae]
MNQQPLLEVNNLSTHFHTERGDVTAVNNVSFTINKGEIIGIVGESGCGKSVMSQSILRILEHTDPISYKGEVLFEGQDLLKQPLNKLQKIRGNDISIIFQDPLSSLNPVYTIGNQIIEVLRLHRKLSKKEAKRKAIELLQLTGIPSPKVRINNYPHELSGGMQQRAMIAIALACEPKLLIADEPTTALDVTIQAQILELIVEINQKLGMAVLFITHDLGVVSEICTSVKVMYLGEIVEETVTESLFETPLHPYTRGLIQSIPRLDANRNEKLHVIDGVVPSLTNVPKCCRFSTRCPYVTELCRTEEPPMIEANEKHKVKCFHYKEIQQKEGRTQ